MESLFKLFVDAVCAIANELKAMNDLKREELKLRSTVQIDDKGKITPLMTETIEHVGAEHIQVTLPDANEREKLLARAAELGITLEPRVRTETVRKKIAEAEAILKAAATGPKTPEEVSAGMSDVFDLGADLTAAVVTKEELQKECADAIQYFYDKNLPFTAEEEKELADRKVTEPDRKRRSVAAMKVRAIVIAHGGAPALASIPVEKYGAVVAALKAARNG